MLGSYTQLRSNPETESETETENRYFFPSAIFLENL